MPRAVASVLMRLWGEELWALPWPGARTPHHRPLGTRQSRGASASPQSGAGSPLRHSQLNLPLLELLQDHLALAGAVAGGELGHGHAPEGLDEQEEPGWEEPELVG